MSDALYLDVPYRPRRLAPGLIARLRRLDAAYRQRRVMDDLSDAQLRDMGLTRTAIDAVSVWDLACRG